jgi:hypothetical protein
VFGDLFSKLIQEEYQAYQNDSESLAKDDDDFLIKSGYFGSSDSSYEDIKDYYVFFLNFTS